jgi:calcium-dependent protein kinase
VIKGEYDEKCDIWALGVIAYQLFSGGEYPFDGDNEAQIYKSIRKGKFYLPPTNSDSSICNTKFDWNQMSEESKEFIKAMLTRNA